MASMASAFVAGPVISSRARSAQFEAQAVHGISGPSSISFSARKDIFSSVRLQRALRFRVSCAAKPETVAKVCEIVKEQLSLTAGTSVCGESKLSALGADSLDTVEIVMALEESFGITVEEENAQTIVTVQDAADLIEKLVEEKSE